MPCLLFMPEMDYKYPIPTNRDVRHSKLHE